MTTITVPEGTTLQESTRVAYTVTGATTGPFSIPFPFFDTTDIEVYEGGILQTVTTDYTISGTAVSDGYSGGSITFTGAISSTTVIIQRNIPIERLADFAASGPFPMSTLNTTLDKLFAILQQIRTVVDRGIRLADTDTTITLTLPETADRLGKYMAFDAVTGSPTAVAAMDSSTIPITTYMESLLTATTAANARTALGVIQGSLQSTAIVLDITAGGDPISGVPVGHDLGVRPNQIRIWAVCTSNESPYIAGESIVIPPGIFEVSGTVYGITIVCDDTSVGISRVAAGGIAWLNKTTGALFTPTPANWTVYLQVAR